MNAILLCSEIPKGMKSYGPKGIIPIGKRKTPLIIKQIKALQKLCDKVYVILGFDKHKILDAINIYKIQNIEFIDNIHYNKTNDGGTLLDILNIVDEHQDYFIISGGVLPPTLKIKKPLENTLYYLLNPVLDAGMNGFDISIVSQENKASYVFYDITQYAWTEMLYMTKETIIKLKDLISTNLLYDSMFLFEIINVAIDNGIIFNMSPVDKKIIKITNHKQIIV